VKQSLSFVTLGVGDLDAARRFYRDGLGWTPTLDIDEVVFFQVAPGVVLALWGADDLAGDVGAGPAQHGTAVALACNVESAEEVHAAVERWRAAGGEVLKEPAPTTHFGGMQAYVADPEGFRWEIAWNPGWEVGADGTVRFA